jgi:hypothetical protein
VQSLKSIYGVFRAAMPVVYCGSLLYYFLGQGGSVADLKAIGLWPTVLGLGAVGLMFCVPLVLRVIRLLAGLRPPQSGSREPPPGESFDAGAILARYKSRQPSEPALDVAAPPPVRRTAGVPRPSTDSRPSFGRRMH